MGALVLGESRFLLEYTDGLDASFEQGMRRRQANDPTADDGDVGHPVSSRVIANLTH
jgi:hypothetical protein